MSGKESLASAAANDVPASVCPLCGSGNACAMAGDGGNASPCWCVAASFSDELLARVPLAARGRACICAGCAAATPGASA
ncbi:MAG: cysteine-rich CWC family protein [Burkholderiales bacterium]|nr:cysteine-rich CWC family protein [Burkholderiales bacterium]